MSTAVQSRPILFSGPMVRAILDGRKTQTRRIVKPQPVNRVVDGLAHVTIGMDPSEDGALWYDADGINPGREMRCPHGRIGDRLWVRETFTVCADCNIFYKADGKPDPWEGVKWKPSIFMPRKASRLTLEITGVRIERLRDISEEDAVAEGVVFGTGKAGECRTCAKGAFMDLWNSINGTDAWLKNPWVWVVAFKKVTQ